MAESVVIAGAIAQRPHVGGHTWQFLQYLLGFRRLGYDVLFIDRLTEEMCGGPVESSPHVRYLTEVMERFALGDAWTLLHPGGTVGLDRRSTLESIHESAALINVMGFLDDEELLAAAPLRVFLDTDPAVGQMWRELGLADLFQGHDVYVTIAENIGRPECTIPTCGIDWVTTPQPVVLDEWAPRNGAGAYRFTSVGSWRGPYAPIEFAGETYGQRVHEFRKFVELPRRARATFEVALEMHPADRKDAVLLEEHGWRLVDPAVVGSRPDTYRDYIHGSAAEVMITRGTVVKTHSGWFSERSMCYLAAGKPVLAQDTGIRELYPVGEGLLVFSTVDEAAAGAEAILADYERHSHAAREVASEYFDSDKVLPRLLEKVGAA